MKTPKEILLEIIPKDCYWEEMDSLTNTPVHYVIEAMERYAKQTGTNTLVSGSLPDAHHDIEADGIVFCGKCGSMKPY